MGPFGRMSKRKQQNDEVYFSTPPEKRGSIYEYNGYLNAPIDVNIDNVDSNATSNKDNIYIKCKQCGVFMDFEEGDSLLTGKYRCPSCGRTMRETTPYSYMERECKRVEDWEKQYKKNQEDAFYLGINPWDD